MYAGHAVWGPGGSVAAAWRPAARPSAPPHTCGTTRTPALLAAHVYYLVTDMHAMLCLIMLYNIQRRCRLLAAGWFT